MFYYEKFDEPQPLSDDVWYEGRSALDSGIETDLQAIEIHAGDYLDDVPEIWELNVVNYEFYQDYGWNTKIKFEKELENGLVISVPFILQDGESHYWRGYLLDENDERVDKIEWASGEKFQAWLVDILENGYQMPLF